MSAVRSRSIPLVPNDGSRVPGLEAAMATAAPMPASSAHRPRRRADRSRRRFPPAAPARPPVSMDPIMDQDEVRVRSGEVDPGDGLAPPCRLRLQAGTQPAALAQEDPRSSAGGSRSGSSPRGRARPAAAGRRSRASVPTSVWFSWPVKLLVVSVQGEAGRAVGQLRGAGSELQGDLLALKPARGDRHADREAVGIDGCQVASGNACSA